MAGGASKGSYEAGVLYGMYHNAEDKSKFEYDVISGVSAGAINAGFLALFDKNETISTMWSPFIFSLSLIKLEGGGRETEV